MGQSITVPFLGMVSSEQIWNGLFAVIQVTVCPGVGIGTRCRHLLERSWR
jgi:hypothetical protein